MPANDNALMAKPRTVDVTDARTPMWIVRKIVHRLVLDFGSIYIVDQIQVAMVGKAYGFMVSFELTPQSPNVELMFNVRIAYFDYVGEIKWCCLTTRNEVTGRWQ